MIRQNSSGASKKIMLWLTSILHPFTGERKDESVTEFLVPGSVCTLAEEKKSTDTCWCLKMEGEGVWPATGDYGFVIPEGCNYMQGRCLEKVSENYSN